MFDTSVILMAPEYNCNQVQCNAHMQCCASTTQMIDIYISFSIIQVSDMLIMVITFQTCELRVIRPPSNKACLVVGGFLYFNLLDKL